MDRGEAPGVADHETATGETWRDPRRMSFSRSVVLAAAAAIVGLVIAGAGLFTAKGTSTLAVPAEDVALVNQQPIARSDFEAQLRSLYAVDPAEATPAERRRVLEDMIREELFVQRGKELDVAAVDPDVRSAMVAAVEQSVAADAVTRQPGEADLKAFYAAHPDRYASEGTITVRDLVFGDAGAAGQAAAAIRGGLAVEDALRRFRGRDTQRTHGEEFYFAARIHLGAALFDVATKTPVGGVGGPVLQTDGAHLLVVSADSPPRLRAFADARHPVLSDERKAAIDRLEARSADFLRRRANILVASDMK
jgi:hypothetical protein